MALTPRKLEFARAYGVRLNATEAALEAGYSPRTAYSIGGRLLKDPEVQQVVRRAIQDRAQMMELKAERVLQEIARLAFVDPRTLFADDGTLRPLSEWTADTAAAVASLEVHELWEMREGKRVQVGHLKKVRLHPKERALEQLGRHLALFCKAEEDSRSISDLLKAVLMELQQHPAAAAALDAEWRPMQPGELPPPPAPEAPSPQAW